jgi:glycerol-3-phosphate cytidylyltransferase-like family protein
MIILFLGKAGSGKTPAAKAMEKYWKDSFVIDGDELRAETNNSDISYLGREANMHLGLSRARRLSDLGFTVFVAMQAPIKEIRQQYLNEYDICVIMKNSGLNQKEKDGYNKNFNPDYSDIDNYYNIENFSAAEFSEKFIPKVLVPARFQGFHKGHKVVLEEAKRISPDITIALRTDDGDIIDLDKNIELLKSRNYKVIKTPSINEDWSYLSKEYDYLVQGNPMVIKKFNLDKIKLKFIPRYGTVSGTDIRNNLENNHNNIDTDVKELIKTSLKSSKKI